MFEQRQLLDQMLSQVKAGVKALHRDFQLDPGPLLRYYLVVGGD